MKTLKAGLALLVLSLLACGCGLLEDMVSFTIETNWRYVTMDTARLGVSLPGGVTVIPSLSCSQDSQCGAQFKCNSGSGFSCMARCLSGKCGIVATFEQGSTADISQEITGQTTATVIDKVSVSQVKYKATENSLNFTTPQIEVLVGPASATSASASNVKRFARMPKIDKGQLKSGDMELYGEGAQEMERRVKDYRNPFKFFTKTTLTFVSGNALPKGKITLGFNVYLFIEPLS